VASAKMYNALECIWRFCVLCSLSPDLVARTSLTPVSNDHWELL